MLRDPRRAARRTTRRSPSGEGLRHPDRRGQGAAHAKRDTETRQGKTPQGRQFYQKGTQDLERGNYSGAANNFRMALTFEPGNTLFQEKLDEAKKAAKG